MITPYQLKPTGVEWIRTIPAHWDMVRIKHGFLTIGSGTTPPSNQEAFYDGDVPWVNTSELRENVVTVTEKMVSKDALREFSALKLYPKGSVLFAMYGATIGRVAILGINATVNQAVCVLADPKRFSARFVFYGLQATRSVLEAIATGGGQPNLNAEKVREHKLPCPPIEEQAVITDFLDNETARIDALVSEKERMLALLEKKRAAIIGRAITKSLDSKTPLKPSGLDWLGDIPKHWDVLQIKHGFQIIGSGTTPPTNQEEFYDGDIPWVTTSELRENVVTSTEKHVSKDALREFSTLKLYSEGTVLFAMYGATIGRVAMLGVTATVNQAVCALAKPDRFFGQYVFYALQVTRDVLVSLATGGGQPNLNAEKVREHKLPCPPLEEQRAIADFLCREISRFDKIVTEVISSIEKIKERRAALIAAAVTGQITSEEMDA